MGKAYGYWNLEVTSNGLRSHGYAKLIDKQADGNPVYADMKTQSNSGICVSPEYTSCTAAWFDYAHDETVRYYDNAWSSYKPMTTAVDPSGSTARARVHVCEDNYFGDPCSGFGYSKGNKY